MLARFAFWWPEEIQETPACVTGVGLHRVAQRPINRLRVARSRWVQ